MSVGSATEGFLVEELEERGRLEIRFSGEDGTTGVNEVFTVPTEARSFTGWINTRATTTLLRSLDRSVVSTPEDEPSRGSASARDDCG